MTPLNFWSAAGSVVPLVGSVGAAGAFATAQLGRSDSPFSFWLAAAGALIAVGTDATVTTGAFAAATKSRRLEWPSRSSWFPAVASAWLVVLLCAFGASTSPTTVSIGAGVCSLAVLVLWLLRLREDGLSVPAALMAVVALIGCGIGFGAVSPAGAVVLGLTATTAHLLACLY